MPSWHGSGAGAGPTNLRLLRPELRTHLPELTDEGLREAIRTKIDHGVDQRAISTLIHVFAPASDRPTDAISRRPVEDIPHQNRAAFWGALSRIN